MGLGLALLFAAPAWALDVSVVALFERKAMLAIDGQRRMLAAGETSPEGVKLVSADSDRAVVMIGGQRRTLVVGEAAVVGGNYAAPKHRAVSLWPDGNGMYHAQGSINGQPAQFMVDTGATFVAFNRADAKRLGIDYRYVGKPVQIQTASRVEAAYLVKLHSVRVGEIELRDVEGVVTESDFPSVILLGMSFLGRLDMTRSGKELRLQKKF